MGSNVYESKTITAERKGLSVRASLYIGAGCTGACIDLRVDLNINSPLGLILVVFYGCELWLALGPCRELRGVHAPEPRPVSNADTALVWACVDVEFTEGYGSVGPSSLYHLVYACFASLSQFLQFSVHTLTL